MKKIICVLTLAVIWLVMMLPVSFAQQLTVQRFSGQDGVEGFAKENDELTIEVLAQMIGNPTPNVARQRAQVHYEDTFTFMDSCTTQEEAMYECSYKTTDLVYGGTDEYTIKLFDSENVELDSIDKTITVDFLAPRILSFSISPQMSSRPVPTTISFRVEDYGSETGKTTECSGIKFLNITADGVTVAQGVEEVGECVKDGTFTFTPTVSGPSEKITVCAVATDYLNHKSLPSCKELTIDSTKPVAAEMILRDSDGFVISHARSTQTIITDVYVRIPDVDVSPSEVYADLSQLNPALGRIQRQDQSGEWFIWRNVQITTPDTCAISVEATDLMGNIATTPLTCSIGIDDAGPVPVSITTQFVDENSVPLLGVNGTINVKFTESGTGMDKANAYLRLTELGLGASVKSDECSAVGNTWTCSWYVQPNTASGVYSVTLLPLSRDDLDNQVSSSLDQNINFDSTAPESVYLKEIAAFRGQNRVITNVTSLGETIEFVVSGAGYTDATADLSDLGGKSEAQTENCVDVETDEGLKTRECTFAVTTAISGPQPTTVSFTFFDIAGNTATISTDELFILGISNETNPNYWEITTQCSPRVLDRQTLSIYEHPVYCQLVMDSPNSLAEPISIIEPLEYSSECTGATEYISNVYIENNFAGSREPYMVLELVATDYEINNLSFTCPVRTLTRVGDFIPQNTEKDNVTVKLDFYNMPLGELYANIDNEVSDVEDKIGGVWKLIGQLQKFMGYAEKFCQILNTVMNIISILSYVSLITDIIGEALEKIPFTAGVGKAMKVNSQQLCTASETTRNAVNKESGLLSAFNKFCQFLTCETGLLDALGADGLNVLGTDDATGKDLTGEDVLGKPDWFLEWISGETITQSPDGSVGQLFSSKAISGVIGKEGQTLQSPNVYLNVKDSLIYSIVIPPLCLPGIIYNLDKWRQIECRYGLCLLEDVKEQGLPISVCKDQKQYMQCRFVVGEIFNIMPFAPLVDYYLKIFQKALTDPLVFVSMGLGYILNCKAACDIGEGINYQICAGMEIASQLGQTVDSIRNMKSAADFGSIGNQWCEDFDDALAEYG